MNTVVVGIDPGLSGGMVALNPQGEPFLVVALKEDYVVADQLRTLLPSFHIFAFVERVHSMPKQGVSSTFKFGASWGFIRGVLTALKIPFEEPTPQVWQKAMSCLSRGDKNVTKAMAQRLYPEIRWTHATADAALIATYGKRLLAQRGVQ
jgi:Holliday junction resolvasome RuvABC endonuclease subunit